MSGTWPCGTPRSTGNAFNVVPKNTATPAAQLDEIAKQKQRNYDRYTAKLLARGTSREEIARKQAERVNVERFSCASNATNSERAPR